MPQDNYSMPTPPDGPEMPIPGVDLDEVRTLLGVIEDYRAALHGHVMGQLTAPLTPAAELAHQVAARQLGPVTMQLDRAGALADKIAGKVMSSVRGNLIDAYSRAGQVGLPVPSDEQVKYGLATGDYLGSLGMEPPIAGSHPAAAGIETNGVLNPPMPPAEGSPPIPTPAPAPAPVGPPGYLGPPVRQPPTAPPTTAPPGPSLLGGPMPPVQQPPAPGPGPATGTCPDPWTVYPEHPCAGMPTHPLPPGVPEFSSDGKQVYWTHDLGCAIIGRMPCYGPYPCCVPGIETLCAGQVFTKLSEWEKWLRHEPPYDGPTGCPDSTGQGTPPVCGADCKSDPATWPILKGATPEVIAYLRSACGLCFRADPDACGGPAPPPPPPPPGPPPGGCGTGIGAHLPMICTDDILGELQKATNAYSPSNGSMSRSLGFCDPEGTYPAWWEPVYKALPKPFDNLLTSLVAGVIDAIADGIASIENLAPQCNGGAMVRPAVGRFFIGLLNAISGGAFHQVTETIDAYLNYQCQAGLPGSAEARTAYYGNELNEEEFKAWVKLAGDCVPQQFKLLNAGRSRPDPLQATVLYRHECLDEDGWKARMRALGVIDDDDRDLFHKLTEAWPGIADIIRFAIRDVSDAQLVQKFGMDDQFEDKWQGDTERYGKAQGVSKSLARNYWRAHWQLPSPTQLYTMLHRLRPDKYADQVDSQGRPLAVDKDTVIQALTQQDILPFWVEKLTEVSYSPLTRVDTYRAYKLGILTEDDVKSALQDLGYDEDNAQTLTDFYSKRKRSDERKDAGYPTVTQAVQLYAKFLIGDNKLLEYFDGNELSDEEQSYALTAAKDKRTQQFLAQVQASVKRLFVGLDIDQPTATSLLINAGMSPADASDLTHTWVQVAKYKPKEISAAALCPLYERGLISDQQYAAKLRKLGYLDEDISILIANCQIKVEKDLATAEQKQAKAALAAAAADTKTKRRK